MFGTRQDFEYYGNAFVYLPEKDIDPVIVFGHIGRSFALRENLPPDQGFGPSEHIGWRAAVILVDPRPHEDGQKVALNYVEQVGKPFGLIRRFVKHLNDTYARAPFHIEVEPIFSPRTFWAFADEHKGAVTSITFEFATPNMFGTSDNLSEELKTFRDIERAQRVIVNIASDDGLNTDTRRVRESVEYTGKGAGKIRAKARDGHTYSSARQTESRTVDTNPNEPLLVRAARLVAEILGQ